MFPDPACGENIHNGDHLFVYDQFSRKQVRNLKGTPGYIDSQIDKVLDADPASLLEVQKPHEKANKHRYPVWYFHGVIKTDDLIAAGGMEAKDKTKDEVYAICTMVNDAGTAVGPGSTAANDSVTEPPGGIVPC